MSIQYPVGVFQEPEGEPNVETMLVIRDASGRTLDVEEIAIALNNARETNALLVGSTTRSEREQRSEYDRLRGLIENRIANMRTGGNVGPRVDDPATAIAQSELSDLLAAFDAGEPVSDTPSAIPQSITDALREACYQSGTWQAVENLKFCRWCHYVESHAHHPDCVMNLLPDRDAQK